jgi:hypothetical protein
MLALPTMIAPAARSRCTTKASCLAAPGGLVAGHIEQFFDQHGYAVQWPDLSVWKGSRRTQGLLGEQLTHGVGGRLPLLERVKGLGHYLDRADSALADRAAHLDERHGLRLLGRQGSRVRFVHLLSPMFEVDRRAERSGSSGPACRLQSPD